MSVDLHSKETLIAAARAVDREVAFMVGSPLSVDSKGGVPGVDATVDLIRNEIESVLPAETSRFEDAIRGKTRGDRYQFAMSWLNANISQNAVNRVVKNAVLQAWKFPGKYTAFGDNTDGQPENWYIPEGTRSLAKLVCLGHKFFKGPILTTNFDPLISLAVRSVGGRPRRSVIDYDGALPGRADEEPDDTSIVHLHGYWRESDTLHTQSQLRSKRPKLRASLQRLLRNRTLIVVAYSGWDDAFTEALAEGVNDHTAEIDILWCFHENDSVSVFGRYERLFERLAPAITRGRFRAYGAIDCHTIFYEMVNAIRTDVPEFSAPQFVREIGRVIDGGLPMEERQSAAQRIADNFPSNVQKQFINKIVEIYSADLDITVRYHLARMMGETGSPEARGYLRQWVTIADHPLLKMGIEEALQKLQDRTVESQAESRPFGL